MLGKRDRLQDASPSGLKMRALDHGRGKPEGGAGGPLASVVANVALGNSAVEGHCPICRMLLVTKCGASAYSNPCMPPDCSSVLVHLPSAAVRAQIDVAGQ